jgi:hypothetical protein
MWVCAAFKVIVGTIESSARIWSEIGIARCSAPGEQHREDNYERRYSGANGTKGAGGAVTHLKSNRGAKSLSMLAPCEALF